MSVAAQLIDPLPNATLIVPRPAARCFARMPGRKVAGGKFFWLDSRGVDRAAAVELLSQAGMQEAGVGWALRFGQVGRLTISRAEIRAVTWLADDQLRLVEVHVWASAQLHRHRLEWRSASPGRFSLRILRACRRA